MRRFIPSLGDNRWQGCSGLIGIVALIVTLGFSAYTFIVQRQVKSLEIVNLSTSSLVQVDDTLSTEITVLYQDQEVENLTAVTISLENNGNQPIRADDFDTELSFVFPEGSEIVGSRIVQTSPANLPVKINYSDTEATLESMLFNKEDRAVIELLVINLEYSGEYPFTVSGRIVDIEELKVISDLERSQSSEIFGIRIPKRFVEVMISTILVLFSASSTLLMSREFFREKRDMTQELEKTMELMGIHTKKDSSDE